MVGELTNDWNLLSMSPNKSFLHPSLPGPDLLGADPLSAGDQDPDLLDEGATAAAPAQTLHDKAKRLDSFLFFNLNPM